MLFLYSGEKTPVMMGMYAIGENRSLIIGARVPVGTGVAAGTLSQEGIIFTYREMLNYLRTKTGKAGVLLMPCVSRYVMLSPDSMRELDAVSKAMTEAGLAFCAGYAGGETCPVRGDDGAWHNRFHQFTFNTLVLGSPE
jgi:hypothetical protein